MEEWRGIDGFPDYEISTWGRVRRVGGDVIGWRRKGRVQTTPRVMLRRDNRGFTVRVSRLVAETFMGAAEEGMYLRFKDNNASNPMLENLYYAPEPHVSLAAKKVRIVEYGHVFDSVSQAAAALEVSRPAIRYALTAEHRTVSGLHLQWVEEKEMADAS